MREIQARGKLWSQTSMLTQWGLGGGGESLSVSKDPGQPSLAAESLLLSVGSSLLYTAPAWFPRNDPTFEPASEPESFMILSAPLSWKQAPFDKLFKLRSWVTIFLFLPPHPQSPSQSVLLLPSVILTPTRLMSGSPWLSLLSIPDPSEFQIHFPAAFCSHRVPLLEVQWLPTAPHLPLSGFLTLD